MKKVIICCIIVIALLVGMGVYYTSERECGLDRVIKLYVKERVKVEDLSIVLSSISDSTCPKGAQCDWQGEYSYVLLLNGEKVTLGTATARKYFYKGYSISLAVDCSRHYIQFVVSKNN